MKKREAQKLSDEIVAVLKQKRIELGITQYKMAQDTGMSKSSILYIETFKQHPSLYTVLMLSDYLGLDLGRVIQEIKP